MHLSLIVLGINGLQNPWGITLWLAVCVGSVASVEAALDPKWNTKAFWIFGVYVSDVCETSWLGIAHKD